MMMIKMTRALAMTNQSLLANEPSISLPTLKMLFTIFLASFITCLGWLIVVKLGDFQAGTMAAGPAGAGLVMVIGFLAVVLMRPWRQRPAGIWINIWMAGIVGRLFITPAAAYLLYSATPLDGQSLLLAVASSYFVVQCSEAGVLAFHLNRLL